VEAGAPQKPGSQGTGAVARCEGGERNGKLKAKMNAGRVLVSDTRHPDQERRRFRRIAGHLFLRFTH
jgi:hypothetical protein